MNVYIAGPMTGIEDYNYPAFHRAAERLRALGHTIISPAEVAHDDGGIKGSIRHADYLRRDLVELLKCDAIALLPGWPASKGARVEVEVATALGYGFYDAGTGLRLGEERPVLDDVRAPEPGRLVVNVLSLGMVQDIADALVAVLPDVKDPALHAMADDVLAHAKLQSAAGEERRGRILREQREAREERGVA